MRKRGRPDKFHQEITDSIINYISIGAPYKDAAEGSGVFLLVLIIPRLVR